MAQEIRPKFGQGELKIEPSKSVFINCPFDDEYEKLFDAIIFATVCCGFLPRSAVETGNVSDARMLRITQALFSSQYSIHELGRCKGEGDENLARFNMPLELGMAMARRYKSRSKNGNHDWLVLVPEGHQYLKFISEISAFDPRTHDGSIDKLVTRVMAWLATRPNAIRTPTPKQVLDALPKFQLKRAQLKEDWKNDVPWAHIVVAATKTVPKFY
jgi:hypothetical protein